VYLHVFIQMHIPMAQSVHKIHESIHIVVSATCKILYLVKFEGLNVLPSSVLMGNCIAATWCCGKKL